MRISGAIRAKEEIAERLAAAQRDPTLTLVLFPIVEHVAALTKRFQIAGQVVARIVIEMSGGQGHVLRAAA